MTTSTKLYKGVRGSRVTEKWQPKKWKPWYDIAIELYATGRFNHIEIAQLVGNHKVAVHLLLTSEIGLTKLEIAKVKIRDKINLNFDERLSKLSERSLDIVEGVLNDDALVERYPLGMLDRAVNFLEGTQKIKGATQNGNLSIQNAIIVGAEQANRIADGLNKLKEIEVLHSGSRPELNRTSIGPGEVEVSPETSRSEGKPIKLGTVVAFKKTG